MGTEIVMHQPQAVIPYSDMERMAAVIAQSGLFGVKNPTQALALMLVAQAEGLHPATAARDYHVIQGRPALKADAMLSKFQAAGGKVEWHEYTDKTCAATFCHPAGGKVRIEWTFEMARLAGLTSKDNWKQYPRAMLRARTLSEGIRTVYPGVLSGMYTPEEVRDMGAVEVIETSGPDARVAPIYDADAADAMIAAFEDAAQMRQWLKDERARMGWKPGDAAYEALKAACAERAKVINTKSQRTPLNPAPGLPATPESLEAAGFSKNPMPFDDALDAAIPTEEAA